MNKLPSKTQTLSLPQILFVDDEERILQGLRRMLRPLSASYQLLFASSADEALDLIRAQKIDIVCTDMKMPGRDGAELLSEVQKIAPSTIRLVLSGQAEESHILRALPYAHQYLPKPCDANNLRETIENISSLSTKLPNARIRESILKLTSVPSARNILNEFQVTLDSPKPNIEDLSTIAKMDIGISTKILHLISCGFLRAKTSATSMTDAIRIIGVDTLRRLMNDYPIFHCPDDKVSQLLIEQTNALGSLIGLSLEEYARAENMPEPELSYLRGLSLLSGRALLAGEYPYVYKIYLSKEPSVREPLLTFEKQTFNVSSLAISATITYLWGVTKIFENSKGNCNPIPNLIEMLENREKQLFGIV